MGVKFTVNSLSKAVFLEKFPPKQSHFQNESFVDFSKPVKRDVLNFNESEIHWKGWYVINIKYGVSVLKVTIIYCH